MNVTTDNIQAYHNTISRTKKKQKNGNRKQKQQPTQKINSKTRQPIHTTNQQPNCRTEIPQKRKKTPKTDAENGARTPKNGVLDINRTKTERAHKTRQTTHSKTQEGLRQTVFLKSYALCLRR